MLAFLWGEFRNAASACPYFCGMKGLDLLAIVAHPDDAEISAGGTLLRHRELGFSTGVVDLTRGELGTRGTADTRDCGGRRASRSLGLQVRDNLACPMDFSAMTRPPCSRW
jgi:N-acetylglucosamine malate deacetylase 1